MLSSILAHKTKRMGERGWENFWHVADIGVRGTGASPEEAFTEAATALTAVTTDPVTVLPIEAVEIDCRASDIEVLFNDWLNALVFEMATRKMLFSRFDVRIQTHDDTLDGKPVYTLHALARGEPVNRERHQPAVEVKGATYTELRVAQNEDGTWIAQCVVDV